jgi:hypothetical protein
VTDDERPAFDLARIVEVFNRHGVVYIAIGGVSGMLHGAVHYVTQDVDLMVRSGHDNFERIVTALIELGADIDRELTAADLVVNSQWQTAAGPIDILLTAAGPNETEITFRELDLSSQLFEVAKGLLVPAASLDDVIRMKEAADRVKDHLALSELRRLRGDAHPERSRDVDPFPGLGLDDDLD